MTTTTYDCSRLVDINHAFLRLPAFRVLLFDNDGDSELTRVADEMWKVMYAEKGIGLAAPQVGVPLALAVIDCEGFKDVLVNPTVVKRKGERLCFEGCLSLPGQRFPVRRAKNIEVEYQTLSGETKTIRARKSVLAQCLEHETDHLGGVLIDGRNRNGTS